MARWIVLGAFFVCLPSLLQGAPLPPQASGQSTTPGPPTTLIPRSHAERDARYRAEHHIILNVLVTDTSGKPVTGLRQNDFTVLDNQQAQKLATFREVKGATAVAPVHVLLMLDAANSARDIADERKAIAKFLGQSQGKLAYPVAIALLTDSGITVGQPSRDGDALISELKKLPRNLRTIGAAGGGGDSSPAVRVLGLGAHDLNTSAPSAPLSEKNGLNERFTLSTSSLYKLALDQEDVPGRAIVIWLGRGWPLLAGAGFRPDTPEAKSNFFAYIVGLSTALREAQMTLDAVASPNILRSAGLKKGYYEAFLAGVPTADQANAANLGLPVLAYQSGGQVLEESNDLASEISACIADAESYYVLSFDSTPSAKGDEYHSLQVTVDRPGLTIRTNSAYYAQP